MRVTAASAAWLALLVAALLLAGCVSQQSGGDSGNGSHDNDDDGDDDAADDDAADDDSADDDATDDDAADDDDDNDDTVPYEPPDGIEVSVYDVGQGDSILVRFPGGSTMLVDGGDNGEGRWVVVPALDALHLDYVDYIVSSHPDADHCGGLDEIVREIEVGEIWWSGVANDSASWQDFSDIADAHGIPRTIVQRGDEMTVDGCDVLVMNADQGWGGAAGDNDNSVVLSIDCEGAVFLLTGDVTDRAQADLIDVYDVELSSDVVKVPHHGSEVRDPDFADMVSPEIAIISVGADNDYGHPAAATIADWESAGADVYRTDQDGAVVVRAKGGQLFLSSGR